MLNHLDSIREMTGIEGFVLRFNDGHMVKIKTEEYVLHHKAKDGLNFEKNVLAVILGGSADDFRVLLSEEDRVRFESFEKDVWNQIDIGVRTVWEDVIQFHSDGVSKKDFALQYKDKYAKSLHSLFFKYIMQITFSMSDIRQDYINIIKKNLTSQSNVDDIRAMFVVNWSYY